MATSANGAYVDTTVQRPLKLSRHGFVEERDPFQLRTKTGEPVLCFRCGGSALPPASLTLEDEERAVLAAASGRSDQRPTTAWRPILSCDFCTLHWHVDCVDPPMSGMPPPTRRWRCPAHSSHARPKLRIPRAAHHITTMSIKPGAPLPNTGAASIDVIPDPNDKHYDEAGLAHSGAPPWEDVFVTTDVARLRYRIPEKTIRLAFWDEMSLRRRRHAAAAVDVAACAAPWAGDENASVGQASRLDQLAAAAAAPTSRPLVFVGPPVGKAREEHANAAAASLVPDAQPFAPAQRTTYKSHEAEPLVPPAPVDQVPLAPAAPSSTYVYPGEIAELRRVKALLADLGPERLGELLHSAKV